MVIQSLDCASCEQRASKTTNYCAAQSRVPRIDDDVDPIDDGAGADVPWATAEAKLAEGV